MELYSEIKRLALARDEKADLRVYFTKNPTQEERAETILPTCEDDEAKIQFIDFSEYLSESQIAKQIYSKLEDYGSDYSFLSKLSGEEERELKKIFKKLRGPKNNWNDELAQVQPWVQACYEKLAGIWGLVVNWDNRYGGMEGEIYGDHYLMFKEWSASCSVDSRAIDFTRCWTFEDKRGWQDSLTLEAIRQCHRYSSRFFHNEHNQNQDYISIITDARKYKLFHVFYDTDKNDIRAGITKTIRWNKNTLQILGRVFKTFHEGMLPLRANGSPQDFGNKPHASYVMPDSEIDLPIRLSELNNLRMDFYNMVLKWSVKDLTSSFPIVRTSFGNVEANVLLGLGPNTAVFGASTTDYGKVAIKFCLNEFRLHREAEILKELEGIKDIPKLLHENLDVMVPYIVTSMVGKKVTEISASIACNATIDILEVLENIHDKGYVHNDIHPGNIVEVDSKFRLIDFGNAVQRFEKRDHIPKHWPKGHAVFASHNRGDYPGARDDLEALCYSIAFMYDQNKLYWCIAGRDRRKAHHRKEEKLLFLFDGLPQAFRDFFCCVYDLDFAATVDYGSWQKMFKHAANDLVSPPNLPKKRALSMPPGSPEYKRSNLELEFPVC
ncbi:5479_t:CDS:2 [Paraglomus brasilianum]|uniref:5479_t:CDS:1 n=1 Tax=Paraglomus brasilianum TaxID=144538 RepID=A0A9N8ZJK4_9GLOM|nr:5479_t:CDS:2 [Paraglomus brasilianum]